MRMKVYTFEGIGRDLVLLPLAARRALDGAGIKVSLSAWQSMPLAARRALVRAGSNDRIDALAVARVIAGTRVPSMGIEKRAEPRALPGDVGAHLDQTRWRALLPLERYVLAKLATKSGERLAAASAEILGARGSLSNHLSREGHVHMVGIGNKDVTVRRAVARARVTMQATTFARLARGATPKGDVLATVRIAGIQAAKRTSELIPLCHAIALTKVDVAVRFEDGGAVIDATVEARDRTGVEMEAMVAASTAALTLYDMLKGLDRGVAFSVHLREKSGGRSASWKANGGDGAP